MEEPEQQIAELDLKVAEFKRQTAVEQEEEEQLGYVQTAIHKYLATNYGQSREEVDLLEAYLRKVQARWTELAADVQRRTELEAYLGPKVQVRRAELAEEVAEREAYLHKLEARQAELAEEVRKRAELDAYIAGKVRARSALAEGVQEVREEDAEAAARATTIGAAPIHPQHHRRP